MKTTIHEIKPQLKWINIGLFLVLSLMFVLAGCNSKSAPQFQQPKLITNLTSLQNEEKDIATAFEDAITGREDVLSFLIFDVAVDHIDLSEDGQTGLIWYSLSDPETGLVISTESGLAIAKRLEETPEILTQNSSDTPSRWEIILQADSEWARQLADIPDTLLDQELREHYSIKNQDVPHANKVYTGYRLPWEPGQAKYLTGSVGHVYLYKTCPSTCLYAFDFGDGTMWPVLAAKAGRIRYAVWEYPNGNTKHSNYIVLEDTSTYPTTYQVYAHLAQNSIPEELRKPGAVVVQGQKIGVVDDTGASTGHHLHFHVHTNPGSYWGTSVDITFDDVNINGGRPRTCNEAQLFPSLGKQCQSGNLFTSGNKDLYVPQGKINAPADNAVIEDRTVTIEAAASDDLGIQSVQVMINYAGEWLLVGEPIEKENFQTSLDLCDLGVPDGNFFVALNVLDTAGKQATGLPGLKTYTKHFNCPLPPPECQVSDNQVGIFEHPQFQGSCELLEIGAHSLDAIIPALLPSINSVQMGSNVILRLKEINEEEIITGSIPDSDQSQINFFSSKQISVEEKPPYPVIPAISINTIESDEAVLFSEGQIAFAWEILDPSFTYRIQLAREDELVSKMDWTSINHWEVSNLETGDYQLFMDVHNIIGDVSSVIRFTVMGVDRPPRTDILPLPEVIAATAFHISWQIEEGDEDLRSIEIRFREDSGPWQLLQREFPPQANQTSFFGNPGKKYEFEIRGIDVNGNAENFHPGPASTITIQNSCVPDLYDRTGDNTIEAASMIELSEPQTHNTCGVNDIDWLTFIAEEGTIYRVTAKPAANFNALMLNVYGKNSSNPIYSTQSTGPGETAEMVWSAPSSGIYSLEVSPLNPRVFGTETDYTLEIKKLVQVHPSGILAALVIPFLWFILRVSKKALPLIKKKS